MLWNYLRFDFGESYFRDISVIKLIKEKLPVSISLGIWMMILAYSVSIPLGIRKAVKDGTRFDVWTSGVIIVGYAIPAFIFAVLLVVVFAGGTYFQWFPLRGLTSENWEMLSWPMRIADYSWHMVLPLLALVIGGFASLTSAGHHRQVPRLPGSRSRVHQAARGAVRPPDAWRDHSQRRDGAHDDS